MESALSLLQWCLAPENNLTRKEGASEPELTNLSLCSCFSIFVVSPSSVVVFLQHIINIPLVVYFYCKCWRGIEERNKPEVCGLKSCLPQTCYLRAVMFCSHRVIILSMKYLVGGLCHVYECRHSCELGKLHPPYWSYPQILNYSRKHLGSEMKMLPCCVFFSVCVTLCWNH